MIIVFSFVLYNIEIIKYLSLLEEEPRLVTVTLVWCRAPPCGDLMQLQHENEAPLFQDVHGRRRFMIYLCRICLASAKVFLSPVLCFCLLFKDI